jgi:hypothetical protein
MDWYGAEYCAMEEWRSWRAKICCWKSTKGSIGQPKWSKDGTLWFASDRTGYWQLNYSNGGNGEVQHLKLKGMNDADFSHPEWFLGRYEDNGIKYREYRALFYEGH